MKINNKNKINKIKKEHLRRNKIEYFNFFKQYNNDITQIERYFLKKKNLKVICSINLGRVKSQFLYESLNNKLDIICGYPLLHQKSKNFLKKYKKFSDFFIKNLDVIERNNIVFFEVSPKRFFFLTNYLSKNIIKKFSFHLVYRTNIIRQAISFFHAFKSGVWHNKTIGSNDTLFQSPNYKNILRKVEEILKNLINDEKKLLNFFKKNKIKFFKQNLEYSFDRSKVVEKFINKYNLKYFIIKEKKLNNFFLNRSAKQYLNFIKKVGREKSIKKILKKRIVF